MRRGPRPWPTVRSRSDCRLSMRSWATRRKTAWVFSVSSERRVRKQSTEAKMPKQTSASPGRCRLGHRNHCLLTTVHSPRAGWPELNTFPCGAELPAYGSHRPDSGRYNASPSLAPTDCDQAGMRSLLRIWNRSSVLSRQLIQTKPPGMLAPFGSNRKSHRTRRAATLILGNCSALDESILSQEIGPAKL